jgi:chemotaxis family two-component system sensor kinase Cph1
MARTISVSKKGDALRHRAEKFLAKKGESAPEKLPQGVQKVIHELEVHQVELEMQNEELRRAQLELMESKDKYAELYDFAPTGYFTLDQKGRIVEVNLTGACQLRVERRSLINRPFSFFVLPEFRNLFRSFQQRVSETGAQQSCELKLVKKDGSSFSAFILGIVVQDPGRKLTGCRCAIMDITERKQAEEALREAKEEADRKAAEAEKGNRILDALMEHVPTGITIVDAKDLRIEVMSRYGQVLTGFPDNQMVGVSLDARAPYWLHPENGTPAKPEELPLFRTIRQGEIVIDEEWILQRPSGERFTILCNAAPIRDSNGNINAGVLAWNDISTQKIAQEKIVTQAEELRRNRDELADRTFRLERLNRELVFLNSELDDFTHMASHDLQEPLRTLTAFSDLLPEDLGRSLPERAADDLRFIRDAARRMETLIHDLLALSRAGRGAKKREKVSLSECVDQALEALATRVKETGAKILRDNLPDV